MTYPVTGTTASALLRAMRARALRDRTGEAVFALATWNVTWSYRYRTRSGSCSIADLTVRADIRVLLPKWRPPATADPALVQRWRSFGEALRRHERGHELNAIRVARRTRAALLALGSRSTCTKLEHAADAAGRKIGDAGRDRDRDYDDETDHGATRGAVFP